MANPVSSPFGGIPRNWKPKEIDALLDLVLKVPPSGGSNFPHPWPLSQWERGGERLALRGIPRNWKRKEIGNSLEKAATELRVDLGISLDPFGIGLDKAFHLD